MCTAGFFLNHFGCVFFGGINRKVRAAFFGKCQFVIVDVDGDNVCAEYFFRVLDTQVAQAARAVNGNPLPWANAGNLHAFVSGYAGTSDAGGLCGVEAVGYFDSIVRIDDTVGRHATVGGVACIQY